MRRAEASGASPERPASTGDAAALSPQVASPARAFYALAALCAAGIVIVLLLGRYPAPTRAAVLALAVQVLLSLGLAWSYRPAPGPVRFVLRAVGVILVGLLTGVSGYFFGPNAGFAGLVAMLVAVAGTLTGGGGGRFPELTGWLTYLALAAGEAVALVLVLTRVVPDHSYTLVIIEPHPMWHHAASHAAVQGIYLAAFLAGRALQRRYRALAFEVDAASRAAARREALLDEARDEYRRAFASGRLGVHSGHTLGEYRLGRKLLDQAASEVYEGVSAQSGAFATVRVLRPDAAQDPQSVERFLHDTEVAVVAADGDAPRRTAGVDERGVPFVAVEDGGSEDLETVLRERGRLPADDLRGLLDEVGGALERLHARGGVHLELSPRSIVRPCRPGAEWRLGDPAVAQLRSATATDAERVGMLRYLAPERLRGQIADARTDVYGLCACAYAALTACDPFGEVPPAVLANKVLTDLPLAPGRLADVTADLEAVLLVGLAKDPADRFAAVADARTALGEALAGRLAESTRERARALGRRFAWSAAPPPAGPGVSADRRAGRPVATLEAPPGATDAPRPAAAPSPAPPPGEAPRRIVTDVIPRLGPGGAGPASLRVVQPAEAWNSAYRSKMRGFSWGITLLCAGGAVLLGVIARDPGSLRVAWASMAGIVAVAWLARLVSRWSREETAYWLWTVIAALSVGPAWAIGLHSAFAAVIAVWLFTGGIFHAAHGESWLKRRYAILGAVLVTHTFAFVLVRLGLVPDRGNVAVLQAGAAAWQTVFIHVLIMGIYGAAFAAGLIIDRGFEQLTRRAQAATREAVRQETLLATARAELDLVLEEEHRGIFSGLRVAAYEVGRVLGRGGMGEVYEATDAAGERVALKLVRGDRVADPVSLRIFLEEADALSRVQSRHVARILEVGGIDRELPYIAMEYIVGRSLAERLRERPALPLEEVRAMVRDVARGLHDVHAAGLVHCDLKPHNLIQTAAGSWKVVDFGGAQRTRAGRGSADALVVVGTPLYMAPEQALGGQVDARADLYSLCVVIYRALTGRVPFLGHTPAEIARATLQGGPPDPRAFVELPRDVVLALRLGLAVDPKERFFDAIELGLAFDSAVDGALPAGLGRRARKLLAREPWTVLPGTVAR